MKNKCIVLCLFMLVSIGCKANQPPNLSGEIVLSNPDIEDTGKNTGILIFNPHENTFNYYAKTFRDLSFSEDKRKVLGIQGDSTFIEYDLHTQETLIVFEGTKKPYFGAKYIPKTNCISYMSGSDLYIYNRVTKTHLNITKAFGEYSWSKDGKQLFYSINGKIKCLNMENNDLKNICDGTGPQLSKDNNYMAFKIDDGLVIREMDTGKSWRYTSRVIYFYKFAPDEMSIAIFQGNTSLKYLYGEELIGWDFRNNKKFTLISHISSGSCANFDWK